MESASQELALPLSATSLPGSGRAPISNTGAASNSLKRKIDSLADDPVPSLETVIMDVKRQKIQNQPLSASQSANDVNSPVRHPGFVLMGKAPSLEQLPTVSSPPSLLSTPYTTPHKSNDLRHNSALSSLPQLHLESSRLLSELLEGEGSVESLMNVMLDESDRSSVVTERADMAFCLESRSESDMEYLMENELVLGSNLVDNGFSDPASPQQGNMILSPNSPTHPPSNVTSPGYSEEEVVDYFSFQSYPTSPSPNLPDILSPAPPPHHSGSQDFLAQPMSNPQLHSSTSPPAHSSIHSTLASNNTQEYDPHNVLRRSLSKPLPLSPPPITSSGPSGGSNHSVSPLVAEAVGKQDSSPLPEFEPRHDVSVSAEIAVPGAHVSSTSDSSDPFGPESAPDPPSMTVASTTPLPSLENATVAERELLQHVLALIQAHQPQPSPTYVARAAASQELESGWLSKFLGWFGP